MERRLSNLGLCQRASGLISGEELVLEGLRSNRIFYIFWHPMHRKIQKKEY